MNKNTGAIQLNSICGYNGTHSRVLKNLPKVPNTLIYGVGGLLVVENVSNNTQTSYMKHISPISAVAADQEGGLIATGEAGFPKDVNFQSTVVITDASSFETIHVFKEIKQGVILLEFSFDGRFLAASGNDGRLLVWDMKDMTIIASVISTRPTVQLSWSFMEEGVKYPKYQLAATDNMQVTVNDFQFELGSMKYFMKSANMQMPSTGFARIYESSCVDPQTGYFYLGSKGGELCVFDLRNKFFRAAIQVGNTSLTSLVFVNQTIYCGFQNGFIRKLSGSKERWTTVRENRVDEPINSIDFEPSTGQIFFGTTAGNVFASDQEVSKVFRVRSGHTAKVSQISISSPYVASIDESRIIKLWKTDRLLLSITANEPSNVTGRAIIITPRGEVLGGFSSGNISCYNFEGDELWKILNTHKGGVSAVYMDDLYLLTGGHDGILRVWHRTQRNLITQINNHSGFISRILVDCHNEQIVHTAASDRGLVSYNIRTDKKLKLHTLKNGYATDMTQKHTPEYEILTCGNMTPVQFWDIDVIDPIGELNFDGRSSAISISPNGDICIVGNEEGRIYAFNPNNKQLLGEKVHSSGITSIGWLDNSHVVTSLEDGSIAHWMI